MSEELQSVIDALGAAEQAASDASTKARKVKKPPVTAESLEDAEKRILDMVGTKDIEKPLIRQVFAKLKSGELERSKTGKISKKEVMELVVISREMDRERKRQWVRDHKPDNYWIVTDKAQLDRLDALMDAETEIGADTETTGLDIYNDRIVGYSVYLPRFDVAAYVVFGHTTGQQQLKEYDAYLFARKHFTRPELRTIWHNYKYDGHLLLTTWGIEVANVYWDTQVVSKILNENEPSHRLKDLHARYVLGKADSAIMFEDLFEDQRIDDKDIYLAGPYACGDADKTYKLYEFQRPHIETIDNLKVVWGKIEQPLLKVDLKMERTGFNIDLAMLKRLDDTFTPKLSEAEREVREAFGLDDPSFLRQMSEVIGRNVDAFSLTSNPHMAYLIYDVLGVDPWIGKKFKKNYRSVAGPVLDALVEEHEQLKPMLKYRQLFKLVTTYVRKLPNAMEPATGRLHCKFNNMGGDDDGEGGTATGRYSSSAYCKAAHSRTGEFEKGTNFQNIPSRSREGKLVRMAFIPDDGWLFVSSDLSQIEPRIIAHILYTQFGDNGMRQLYLDGRDLYTEMAMFTFGFPRENCVDGAYDPTDTFQPRKLMKEGVLAFLYGQSPKSFAKRMKVDESVAAAFFSGMTSAYPGLEPFRQWVLDMLLKRGSTPYAETLFGRKRRFPDYRKNRQEMAQLEQTPYWKRTQDDKERRNKLWGMVAGDERRAVNAIIQGTAADVLKQAIIELDKLCDERGFKFMASIHDETMISVPSDKLTPELIQRIESIMTETTTFSVPLRADTVIQTRWMCEFKPDEWDYETGQPRPEFADRYKEYEVTRS